MGLFSKKYTGPDSRSGSDRRSIGRWATHLWGIILVLVFSAGVGTGITLRADDDSVAEAIEQATEGDIVRSQVLLDSLVALGNREPIVQQEVVFRDVLVYDTVPALDTLLVEVAQEPQIIEVIKEVLVIDTVFAPPQIITIPAPEYGFFSSEFFKPRAGNLLYLLGGVALGTIIDNDASACIFVSTDGTVRENCDPKR